MLVILQLYLQKSLAQQVILLFNLFFESYFYFLFYKKRKIPNIKDPFLRTFIVKFSVRSISVGIAVMKFRNESGA